MSRLRLAAGSAIMKLAQEPCYHEIITPEQFQLCALVINVSNYFYIEVILRVQSPSSELLLLLNWLFNIAHCGFREFLKLQILLIQHLLIFLKHVTPSFQLDVFHFYFVLTKLLRLHSYVLFCYRMSATKWGRYLLRNCIKHLWNYCSLWNIWQSLLCVPKILWRREEHMPDSACLKTSVYEENILSRILWLTVSVSVNLWRIQWLHAKLEEVMVKS